MAGREAEVCILKKTDQGLCIQHRETVHHQYNELTAIYTQCVYFVYCTV